MPFCFNKFDKRYFASSLRGILRVVVLCAIAIMLIPSMPAMILQAQTGIVEYQAIVSLKDGTGYIKRNHKIIRLKEGVAAQALARDKVVAQTGTITITYSDDQVTTLSPRSEIEIVYHAQIDGEERIVLLQHAGSSINRVDKPVSNGSRFEVQTASSIAAVDATQFAVELSDTQQVRYSSNLGTVKIFMSDQKPVEVKAGYEAAVQSGEPISVAPMHNTRRTALFTKKVASSCTDQRIQLKQPSQEQMREGVIDFYGTATHEEFDYYKIEYTVVGRPANKYSWLYRGDEPVEDDLLASVDASDLAAGEYVIRLMIVDKEGNYPKTCSINLEIE